MNDLPGPKGESAVVVAIVPLRIEVSYCTSNFLFWIAKQFPSACVAFFAWT